MEYQKADDISYVDLKEVCQIFNQKERFLGARINIRRKGFDDLMEAFIKTVLAVSVDRWEHIPGEVMAFYKALPVDCFKAIHITAAPRAKTGAGANDGIPDDDPEACGKKNGSPAAGRTRAACLSLKKGRASEIAPRREGKMKVKVTIGLGELVQHLDDLVCALKAGRLCIVSRNRTIMMQPDDSVNVRLLAGSRKDGKSRRERLAVKLEWMRAIAEDDRDDFSISGSGLASR
jgi:hypothetical protein